MRFHILGLSHTRTTREYSACAFTQKIRLLCKMLMSAGHTVYHYGTEGSNVVCTEHVDVLDSQTFDDVHGAYDWKIKGFDTSRENVAYTTFRDRARQEIGHRLQQWDFILCPFGWNHEPIAKCFPRAIVVEPGIGYEHTFADFRVWESQAWRHYQYGKEGRGLNPPWYDAVIPNYIDFDDYPFIASKMDYAMWLGRPTALKGRDIAERACAHAGVELYVAGQGTDPSRPNELGVLSIEDRAAWVGKAKALLVPTQYLEPFGTVVIEALAYGTPVLASDHGAFTETVQHGQTGYLCNTMSEFVRGLKSIDQIRPEDCRIAAYQYGLAETVEKYDRYFSLLKKLHEEPEGWYAV